MVQFNVLLVAAVIGACLGSILRPGPIEIVVAACVVGFVWPKVVLFSRRRSRPSVA